MALLLSESSPPRPFPGPHQEGRHSWERELRALTEGFKFLQPRVYSFCCVCWDASFFYLTLRCFYSWLSLVFCSDWSPSRTNSSLWPPLSSAAVTCWAWMQGIYCHCPSWKTHAASPLPFDQPPLSQFFPLWFWSNFLSYLRLLLIFYTFFFAIALNFFLANDDHHFFYKDAQISSFLNEITNKESQTS